MKIDKKTIIMIVLVVAAVVVAISQFKKVPKSTRPAAQPAGTPATATATTGSQTPQVPDETQLMAMKARAYQEYVETLEESDIDFDRKKLRNPMTPLVREKGGSGASGKSIKQPGPPIETVTNAASLGYKIEGIVWDELEPLALINDQVVGVGDRLDDESLIVQITKRKVRFTRKGREYFLEFREE